MKSPIKFDILNTCESTAARVGRVETPHGSFDTPTFMPVGTKATIKGLTPDQVKATGSQIILNNAYHLMLRPGSEQIRDLGGSHEFMKWDGPILTDSGGYQAYSMSDINKVDDDGVTFKSIIDGSMIHLRPESSMKVQNDLGADIIMAFDDCPPSVDPASFNETRKRLASSRDVECSKTTEDHFQRLKLANERTIRWLERCAKAHDRPEEQALFGIIQGGTSEELRTQSAEQICNMDLPGYAIGGVAVGEGPELIKKVVEFTAPLLPVDKPRYLMGVGYELDLVMAARAGCDMFDCVLPTRNGRNGCAFTRTGRLQLRNARFRMDKGPIDESCDCPTCSGSGGGSGGGGFSRAYLRHLFMSGEMLGPILVSVHNISHFQHLMLDIRHAVRENNWSLLMRNWPVLESQDSATNPEDSDLLINHDIELK